MTSREIIQRLCDENGITVSGLEKELGFSNGSLKKEGSLQSDRLLKVAQKFNVTMEYLMGIENENGKRILFVGNPFIPGSVENAARKNEESERYYSENKSFQIEIVMNGEKLYSKKIDGATTTPQEYFDFHNKIDNLGKKDFRLIEMLLSRFCDTNNTEVAE